MNVLTRMHNCFRRARAAGDASFQPVYALYVPEKNCAYLGLGVARRLAWTEGAFDTFSPDVAALHHIESSSPLHDLGGLLNRDSPCFFLVSSDINRKVRDAELALVHAVEPCIEIRIDDDTQVAYAIKEGLARRAAALIAPAAPSRLQPAPVLYPVEGWRHESDESVLDRLRRAVETLHDREGKMIVTNAYVKERVPNLDSFRLYEIYSTMENDCAASHYADLSGGIVSIGCSPENIFQVEENRLMFDIVAGTRGVAPDPEIDRRWEHELTSDAKEAAEHDMALRRYRARLEQLCVPGSVSLERHRDIQRLRHVRHLRSRLSGRLPDSADAWSLLESSFPPLRSYPEELVPLADPGLEPLRYYGGMLGRAAPGRSDISCFLNIRAALLKPRQLYTLGGVGVIRGARPEGELLEIRNKLHCLMQAVGAWESEAPC